MQNYGYVTSRDTDLFPFVWFRSNSLTFCEGVGKSFWVYIDGPITKKDLWVNLSSRGNDIVVFNNPFMSRSIACRSFPDD